MSDIHTISLYSVLYIYYVYGLVFMIFFLCCVYFSTAHTCYMRHSERIKRHRTITTGVRKLHRHVCNVNDWRQRCLKDKTGMVYSEWKNRSIFLTPQKWLFWHKLSSMDLRECILAIFGPLGPLGGVRGGPWDQNFQIFLGPHLGSKMLNFELYELKTLYFPGFWPKIAPQEAKNGLFWLKWV